MIWICFWNLSKFNLYALERDFEFKKHEYSAKSYLRVLNDNLLEVYESGFIFMQDNAFIHIARKVREWFDENDIIVMKWPSYSSNLNFIEHFWFLFKERVYQINSNIENVKSGENVVRKTLFEALFKTWESLEDDYLHDLVWSMKKRVKAIIKSEGWYTKY